MFSPNRSQGRRTRVSKLVDWVAATIGMTWVVITLVMEKKGPQVQFAEDSIVSMADVAFLTAQCLVLFGMAGGRRFAYWIWIVWCGCFLENAVAELLFGSGHWHMPLMEESACDAFLCLSYIVYCVARLRAKGRSVNSKMVDSPH